MTFTETNVDVAIEISLPLDFPEPDFLEVEGNEMKSWKTFSLKKKFKKKKKLE